MATGLKGPDLNKRLVKFVKAIEGASVDTVKAAADKAKAEHLKVMRPDSGGDLKLSHVGRAKGRPGNAKIGVNYKVSKATGSRVSASAILKATGPLPIINNDISGHVIRSAYSRGRHRKGLIGPSTGGLFSGGGRGGKAVLAIPGAGRNGMGFVRSARHPGTKGKRTWQRGFKKAKPVIRKQMSSRTTTTIKKGMAP